MEYKLNLAESNNDFDNSEDSKISFTPMIKTGFNSYYIDKLKHLKESIKTFKSNDVVKSAKPYKIISPCSVSKDSVLNKEYNFGTKQDNYIVYEIVKSFKLSGSVYSFNSEKINKIIETINIKDLKNTPKVSDCDIIFNNSKVNFLKNFYNQEVQFIPELEKTLKECEKLKTGGCCITRIYNVFLNDTIDILIKFISMFKEVYIFKPETSDNYKVDKYLICLDKLNKQKQTENKEIEKINVINTEFINSQTKAINEVINYINKRNYHGMEYNNYMEIQKEKQNDFLKKIK